MRRAEGNYKRADGVRKVEHRRSVQSSSAIMRRSSTRRFRSSIQHVAWLHSYFGEEDFSEFTQISATCLLVVHGGVETKIDDDEILFCLSLPPAGPLV